MSKHPELPSATAQSPHPETVALMYEALMRRISEQSADWNQLDAKAYQALAAGGVTLGVASLGVAGWAPWLVLAAVAFLCTAAASIAAAWPQTFTNPFDARRLFDEHWTEAPADLRYAMVYTAAREAAPANSVRLRRKSQLVTAAFAGFSAEALFIALWAVSAL